METQTEQSGSRVDTALLAAAAALLVGVIVAFYYFAVQWALPVRLAVLLGGLAGCVALTYQTELGKLVWAYLVGSRAELRKVVWPSRQESLQTTLLIAVVVLIVALLMWGLDSLLLLGVHQLTQRGA
jgi:preprotein translocase subunit SecE